MTAKMEHCCNYIDRVKLKYPETNLSECYSIHYWDADKSLARPGRKQARKHVRDARDFNNIETRAVKFPPPPTRQGAEGNSRHSDRN